jgi:hypothetical protein
VVRRWPADIQDFGDRRIREPRELPEIDERLTSAKVQQKPCLEMFVTSTSSVVAPALFNFDMSFLEHAKDSGDLALRNPLILSQFDATLKPHLDLAVG